MAAAVTPAAIAAAAGDYIRQGDLLIHKLDGIDHNAERVEVVLQLAPGTTKGSRHILSSGDGIDMFTIPGSSELQGPQFVTDREVTVEHPEHGDWILGAGTYGVTYERMYAEELRRVKD